MYARLNRALYFYQEIKIMPASFNYKHLHYFWMVAHEGSIAKASEKLHITPQTISGQLSILENSIGSDLFAREGRGLRLTETGRLVLKYADEIFDLGRELGHMLRGNAQVGPSEFIVSAASALPKTIVQKIIEPGLQIDQDISLTSREGPVENILADLAIHKVDMVLSDTPLTGALSIKAYNHRLGASSLTFFASKELTQKFKPGFPQSLNQAPMLLPTTQYAIRQSVDYWLSEHQIYPNVRGQFDDSALMKSFGQAGLGIFFMPTIIAEEVCRNFDVEIVGKIEEIKQTFYAISAERKVKHPAVAAICDTARTSLFV
jgi:LysR family transcriptional activator of nhaA